MLSSQGEEFDKLHLAQKLSISHNESNKRKCFRISDKEGKNREFIFVHFQWAKWIKIMRFNIITGYFQCSRFFLMNLIHLLMGVRLIVCIVK